MQNIFIRLMISILFLCISCCSYAKETAQEELFNILSSFSSMSADFSTKAVHKHEKSKFTQRLTGKMVLLRPGKFKWEIEHPDKQLIIADGKNIWIYDADLAQVMKRKIDYRNLGIPAVLLSDSIPSLKKAFVIKKSPKSTEKDKLFSLKCKSSNDTYQLVKLHFQNGKFVMMNIIDNLGQENEVHFSNIKTNIKLPKNAFQFKPAKNVDVIEG